MTVEITAKKTSCTYHELRFRIENLIQQAKDFARLSIHEDVKESGLYNEFQDLSKKKLEEKRVLYDAMIVAMKIKQAAFDNRSIDDVEKAMIKLKMQTDTIYELTGGESDDVKKELINMATEKISLHMELEATFNEMQQTIIVELEEF